MSLNPPTFKEKIMEYVPIKNKHNPLYGLSYDQVKESIKDNPFYLRYVHNKTDELCKIALEKNGNAIKYVPVQTDELCKIAVQTSGTSIIYVINQTDEICKLALKQSCNALFYCKVKTKELCILAVQDDYFDLEVLGYIPDEFIEECLTFVDKTLFEENDLDAPLIAK